MTVIFHTTRALALCSDIHFDIPFRCKIGGSYVSKAGICEGRTNANSMESSTAATPRARDASTLRSPIIKWLQEIAQIIITILSVGDEKVCSSRLKKRPTWHVRSDS